MRHWDNEALSYCAPLLNPPLERGWVTINPDQLITKLIRKLTINPNPAFFENLSVRNYGVDCTEITMAIPAACLYVKLFSASPLSLGIGGAGGVPSFGIGHKKVFSSRTIRPIRLKLVMRQQGNEAFSGCDPLLNSLLLKGLGTIDPKSGIF